jgi:hypothetical protein
MKHPRTQNMTLSDGEYFFSINEYGNYNAILIHAPDGRVIATLSYWADPYSANSATRAHADAKLILDALNAYRHDQARQRNSTMSKYHVTYESRTAEDEVIVRTPDGREIFSTFICADPVRCPEYKETLKDIELIVDALNAHRRSIPQRKDSRLANPTTK